MNPNFYILFLAALIPLAVGSLWYSGLLFEKPWMKVAEMTEDKMKGANMAIIFGLTYVLGLFIAGALWTAVVHQQAVLQILAGQPGFETEGSPVYTMYHQFMEQYGHLYRTFGHGALHGTILGFIFAMPVLAINALFERRGFMYIAIHSGYWIVTLALMGGVICAFI